MSMNPGAGAMPYNVQPGDTLWELANENDTTIEDIMAFNPGIDPDNLMVGQVIYIPDNESVDASQRRPEHGPEHRPERGRERRFERRPFRPYRPYRYYRPYYPYAPYYPAPVETCPAGARPYTVQPGDNLYNIAARFGVSVDAIIAANPYVNFGLALQIGQFLCIPF